MLCRLLLLALLSLALSTGASAEELAVRVHFYSLKRATLKAKNIEFDGTNLPEKSSLLRLVSADTTLTPLFSITFKVPSGDTVHRTLDLEAGKATLSFQVSKGEVGDFLLQDLKLDLSELSEKKLDYALSYFSADNRFTGDSPHAAVVGAHGRSSQQLRYSFLVISVDD